MANLSIRLPDELDQRLAEEANRESRPRSEVARDAIQWYLDEMKRRRFIGALVADARRLTERETVEIAEESLPLDNETLAIGEPSSTYKTKRKKKK